LQAINYLLARPDASAPTSTVGTPNSRRIATPQNRPRSQTLAGASSSAAAQNGNAHGDIFGAMPNHLYSLGGSASESRLTPKASARARGSIGAKSVNDNSTKRRGTAADEYHRRRSTMGYSSPSSVKTFSDYGGGAGGFDYQEGESLEVVDRSEIPDGFGIDDGDDEGFEGLENVRACCGGKHDGEPLCFPYSEHVRKRTDCLAPYSVGSLSRRHNHSHSHSHSRHHQHNSSTSFHSDNESRSRSTTPLPPTTPSRARSKSSSNTLGSISRRLGSVGIGSGKNAQRSVSRKSSNVNESRPLSPLPVNSDFGNLVGGGRRTPVP